MNLPQKSKTFGASLSSLGPIRDFLSDYALKAGLTDKKIGKLTLAVDEIATNIINYGYAQSKLEKPAIKLTILANNEHLKVVCEDDALEFNPLKKELPGEDELTKPPEERKIGGLGIMLALNSVDTFDYEYKNNKNYNIFYIKSGKQNG